MNEVVDAAIGGSLSVTELDPITARGYCTWQSGVRRLREIGLKKQFLVSNESNVPWIVDKKRGNRFTVVITVEATGENEAIPSNLRVKGVATLQAIKNNSNLLFDYADLPQMTKPAQTPPSQLTFFRSWYLCIHLDGTLATAELSFPISMNQGFFSEYDERIMVRSIEESGLPLSVVELDDSIGKEIEIKVSKK